MFDCWLNINSFLYQLKAKAISRTKSPCCTLLVLTAEGQESGGESGLLLF